MAESPARDGIWSRYDSVVPCFGPTDPGITAIPHSSGVCIRRHSRAGGVNCSDGGGTGKPGADCLLSGLHVFQTMRNHIERNVVHVIYNNTLQLI